MKCSRGSLVLNSTMHFLQSVPRELSVASAFARRAEFLAASVCGVSWVAWALHFEQWCASLNKMYLKGVWGGNNRRQIAAVLLSVCPPWPLALRARLWHFSEQLSSLRGISSARHNYRERTHAILFLFLISSFFFLMPDSLFFSPRGWILPSLIKASVLIGVTSECRKRFAQTWVSSGGSSAQPRQVSLNYSTKLKGTWEPLFVLALLFPNWLWKHDMHQW